MKREWKSEGSFSPKKAAAATAAEIINIFKPEGLLMEGGTNFFPEFLKPVCCITVCSDNKSQTLITEGVG